MRRVSGAGWGAVATWLSVLVAVGATGCGSNDSETSGTGDATSGSGGASASTTAGAGGEGAGGVPAAQDFLPAEAYDCRAANADVPVGARPHDDGCISDRDCRSRFIMAHRMGNTFGPENSLSVLRASIQLGVDVVETDIRITADDRVVFIHDSEVDRTLEGTGDVRDFTLAEIQAMAIKLEGNDPPGEFGCERAPSLEDAMAVARGKIVVELETKNIEAAPIAAAYLRDNDLYAWAYVQGNAAECVAAREGADDVPLAFRLESLDDLPMLEALDPPPIFVEIDDAPSIREDPAFRSLLEERGIKLFTNAFVSADVLALTGDYSQYDALFDKGYDMLQSEAVHLAMFSQDRIAPR